MVNQINGTNGVGPVRQSPAAGVQQKSAKQGGFAEALDKAMQKGQEIGFSAHAQQRITSRNINLSPSDISALGEACSKAQSKGSKESLLLLRDLGFVVNVQNRNVVTAIDKDEMKDKVFTNIDSTVIVG